MERLKTAAKIDIVHVPCVEKQVQDSIPLNSDPDLESVVRLDDSVANDVLNAFAVSVYIFLTTMKYYINSWAMKLNELQKMWFI